VNFLTASQLKELFRQQCPYTSKGELIAEERRVTVLAANANFPLEIYLHGLMRAAAHGAGSPLIIQLSQNALRTIGGDPKGLGLSTENRRSELSSDLVYLARGAKLAKGMLAVLQEQYQAPAVALALDHFRPPPFEPNPVTQEANTEQAGNKSPRTRGPKTVQGSRNPTGHARKLIEQALDSVPTDLLQEHPGPKTVDGYVNYLTGVLYRNFKDGFITAITILEPAWAMVDTADLPPVLNFAVTRDILISIRTSLGPRKVLLEAEFGAAAPEATLGSTSHASTGDLDKTASPQEYAAWVEAFVVYTGTDAIAYPIGMAHGAKRGESHQPNLERLQAVQSRLFTQGRHYIPFVQHGGTGAAFLARGLVGKNNVNTYFMVAAMNAMADHATDFLHSIRKGEKSACGPDAYAKAIEAVTEAALLKLRECRTYGKAPELAPMKDE